MKKLLSLTLVLIMLSAMLTGCNGNGQASPAPSGQTTSSQPQSSEEPSSSEDSESLANVYPIVTDGTVTLSIWKPLSEDIAPYVQDLADGSNYLWKTAMEKTGVNIKFTHPATMNQNEQFQLLVAGGDYPDIITTGSLYTGGVDKAIQDGVYLRINDIVEKLCPNYFTWVNQNEYNQKNAYTDSGNFVGFAQVYDERQSPFQGYLGRQDWMDKLGIETPTTLNEWYTMLQGFKENFTDGRPPMQFSSYGMPMNNVINGAFGISNFSSDYLIIKDGKLEFSADDDGMRRYLEMMSKWYAEGLIDTDFVAQTFPNGIVFQINDMVASNQSGLVPGMFTFSGDYMAKMGIAEEGAFFSMMPYPVVDKGDQLMVTAKSKIGGNLTSSGAAISTDCANPEYAARFMDWFYSEEGVLVSNFGIEGVTFNYVDGKPVQTDLIRNNPDGLTVGSAQSRYLSKNGIMVVILNREEKIYEGTEAIKYKDIWNVYGDWTFTTGDIGITYTAEEGAERSSLFADVDTYIKEFLCSVITGQKTLDDNTWNEYVNKLKSMQVDRIAEITQTAYDRYIAR